MNSIQTKVLLFVIIIIAATMLHNQVLAVVGELEMKTDTITGDMTFPKPGTATSGTQYNSYDVILTALSGSDKTANSFKLRNTAYTASSATFRFGIINQGNTEVFSIKSNGYVGVGTTNPDQLLTVAGTVESTTGGFKFPDGTTQTSAYAQTFPANMIVFSSTLSSCPSGWSALTAANGRLFQGLPASGTLAGTVGTALTTGSPARTITGIPNHTHTYDLPSAATGTESVTHSHTYDPPQLTTGSGSHNHSVDAYLASGVAATLRSGLNTTTTTGTVTTDTQYHYHTTNIAAVTSSAASATHTHTLDIVFFNSGSTGSASVDVTMPYIQYLACIKD